MLNILESDLLDKASTKPPWRRDWLASAASIDTAWVLINRWNGQLVEELKGSGARDVKVRRIRGHDGTIYWWAIRITKPGEHTWRILAEIKKVFIGRMLLSRIDIAVDFRFADWHAAEMFRDWVAEHVVLKWNTLAKRFWYETTLYYTDNRGRTRPRRTLVMYPNKRDDRIVRLELRLQNTAAVRANGLDGLIDHPKAWQQLSPRNLFEKHVMLREVSKRFIARKVRQALVKLWLQDWNDDHQKPLWQVRWQRKLPLRTTDAYRSYATHAPKHSLPTTELQSSLLLVMVPTKLQY